MRKSDKKIECALRVVLTEVCEIALVQSPGFEWLTHFVDYNRFPASLTIVCVYDTNEHLLLANKEQMCVLIQTKLASIDIKLKAIQQHIRFETKESFQKGSRFR